MKEKKNHCTLPCDVRWNDKVKNLSVVLYIFTIRFFWSKYNKCMKYELLIRTW